MFSAMSRNLRRWWRRLRLLFTGDRKGPGATLH